ncbi:tyrosine-type recombinase/integrase [Kordiimonas sp.]|uniref:tyrosine-type recombinase/integrase n=1 Tax=Kordiimonas sp. TaxID=1970157 RepID=UPI003B52B00F
MTENQNSDGPGENYRAQPRRGLTDTAIKQTKPLEKPFRLTDGKGLYILVQPSGAKWWRFDYSFGGRRKTLSMGTYPDVSLSEARDSRHEARRQLRDGVDPSHHRKQEKVSKRNLFKDVADDWFNDRKRTWSETYVKPVKFRLYKYILPALGARPVNEIEPPEVLAFLRSLGDKLETVTRCKQICGQIFRYAVAHGLAKRDPTADLRGILTPPKAKSMAAITDPRKVGGLLRAIDAYEGYPVVRHALRLAPLVFVRPGELRHMEWAEVDLKTREWRIPKVKTKMRDAHLVPLSRQAVTIIKELQPLTGRGKYLFPSVRSFQRPISENTLNAALRRMGFTKDEMTSHGFRAMASTLLNEQGWKPDIIERQLAHAERNKVRAAYNRAEHIAERTKMMQAWADYLQALAVGADVVSFKGGILA